MTHDPLTPLSPPVAPAAAPSGSQEQTPAWWGPLAKLPLWLRITIVVAVLVISILLWQMTVVLAVAVLITAIVAVAKNRPTWLQFASPKHAKIAIAVSAVIAMGFSTIGTAATASPSPSTSQNEPAGFASLPSATPSGASEATPSQAAKPSPTPSPAPVVEKKQESVTEAIAYTSATEEDWNLESGQTRVSVAGVAGVRTITYEVTYTDGVETARVEVSNLVTTQPINEVVAVGMYTPPAAFAGGGDNGCDPNYAEGCVPIASDVDCAWGTGNGPAYFDGVARVVGSDIYDLDRDNDGFACERD